MFGLGAFIFLPVEALPLLIESYESEFTLLKSGH
jgi:hypothetical protein